jgi:putative ABC transport system permease protein
MKVQDTFLTSIKALFANGTRTFLTTLGVIIGVFSVVTLVSLVQGVRNYITEQFSAVGSNLFFVSPGKITGIQDDPSISFSTNKLRIKHVDLLERYAGDYIVGATPLARVSKPATYKTRSYTSSLTGTNEKIRDIADIDVIKGRYFTKAEVKNRARVGVIHPAVANELFGSKTAGLGKKVKVGSGQVEIIGVAEEKNREFDDRITMPHTTVTDLLEVEDITFIGMKAKNGISVDVATRQVELALLRDLKKDDFSILSQQDILKSVESILGMLGMILGAIAGVSLLVGGIGIMNIMLVSVTERTREIGLRKALGATSPNIALQFLIESSLISMAGGILGLVFGWLATLYARNYIQAEIPAWACFLGIGFSLLVGVGFGTYPALQAAKKQPIEALRYE